VAAPVVILCGGQGTRIRGHAGDLPKALVPIGDRPIVEHVIELYAAQGYDEFMLAAGHRAEALERWSLSAPTRGVSVTVIDTGELTETGGRVAALAPRLRGRGPFHLTYADGLADIDLRNLEDAHRAGEALATVTLVRPELQFGVAQLGPGDRITGFSEKPRSQQWINGGFMFLEEAALDFFKPDSVLERDVLPSLADAGALRGERHEGFWRCMDTYKDALALDELCRRGGPPWLATAPTPA